MMSALLRTGLQLLAFLCLGGEGELWWRPERFWEEPKLRKVVGLAWVRQVCSELTDTDTETRIFLGEDLETVILGDRTVNTEEAETVQSIPDVLFKQCQTDCRVPSYIILLPPDERDH